MANKRKNVMYSKMYELYSLGNSLSKVGKTFGVTRQSVYSGFKLRNYILRKKKKLIFEMFDGIKFTLATTGYLRATKGSRELMHRYVWTYYFGEIPNSYDIHHMNRNKVDNRIENLKLISKSEHAKKYNTGSNQYVNRGKN